MYRNRTLISHGFLFIKISFQDPWDTADATRTAPSPIRLNIAILNSQPNLYN